MAEFFSSVSTCSLNQKHIHQVISQDIFSDISSELTDIARITHTFLFVQKSWRTSAITGMENGRKVVTSSFTTLLELSREVQPSLSLARDGRPTSTVQTTGINALRSSSRKLTLHELRTFYEAYAWHAQCITDIHILVHFDSLGKN